MAQRSPEATEEEWARASDVDGVSDIIVHDLLYQAPPNLDVSSMHGVIRSVILKLDSRRNAGKEIPDGADSSSA